MSYCSTDQVKLLSRFTVFKPSAGGQATFSDSDIQDLIDRADMTIRSDLSMQLDFTRVGDIYDSFPTPEPLQTLSVYKTTELALVTMHGAQRTVQQVTDIQWWQKQYEDLKKKILRGATILVDATGASIYLTGQRFINTDKTQPQFGDTKYGDFMGIQNEGEYLEH